MNENRLLTLLAAVLFLALAALGAYLVTFDRDCNAKGGKTVRGLFGLECVSRAGE